MLKSADLSRLNANLLVALDLLLEEQSVGRAAERNGVTPSAMSHSLKALRALFGDVLLVKTRRGMRATPLALGLRGPLRRALNDLGRAISTGIDFDPTTGRRSFVVAAPDFVSTMLMPHVARLLHTRAPAVDVEIRPVQRRGSALLLRDAAALAEGEIDLVIGGILGDIPEITAEPLYEERFVCIVRRDHPLARRPLDLRSYARASHLVVTITDERTPTWIDEALAREGLERHVALRTRYFMAAPLIVAESDMLATCPYQLARYFAERVPIAVLEPPLPLPRYAEHVAWHERYDQDPALQWLRGLLRDAARAATGVRQAPKASSRRASSTLQRGARARRSRS